MTSEVIAGIILLVVGTSNVIKPEILISLQVAIAKKIYGATYKPTAKTSKVQRVIGGIFLILGVLILTGII